MAIGDVLSEITIEGTKYTFGDAEQVDGRISCHGCLMPNNGNDKQCFDNHIELLQHCFETAISTGFTTNCQVVKIEEVS